MLVSTRSDFKCNASYAIVKGLAKDGGLFVFEKLNHDFFSAKFVGKSYKEVATLVMRELLDDFTDKQIKGIVEQSYDKSHFPNGIIGLDDFGKYSYLNLYYGNTFAFKDMALSVLPNLMETAKEIQGINKESVILTATSGDTGSATLSGFSNLENTSVIVLYPESGVSEFQELQMNFFNSDRFIVMPIKGNFDDCQRIVKQAFSNLKPNNITLTSANSINIGRIIPQIVYYVYAYSELVNRGKIEYGNKINITVPTGNFGNIYSAYLAKQLGVPIDKLIIASNINNVLTDIINKSVYDIDRELYKTISPSMDILVSSNFERYLYQALVNNPKKTKEVIDQLIEKGTIELEFLEEQLDFFAYYATEEKTEITIKKTFENDNYLIDPHTAVAKYCAERYLEERNDDNHMLIVSTASPFKFTKAMLQVLGNQEEEFSLKDGLIKLSELSSLTIDERMLEVLETKNIKVAIPLEKAYSEIERIVGDLDAKS